MHDPACDDDENFRFLDLLGELTPDQFFSEYWDRRPVVLRPTRLPNCLNSLTRDGVLDWYFEEARENARFTSFSAEQPALADGRERLEPLFANTPSRPALEQLALDEAFVVRDLVNMPAFEPFIRACARFWKTKCSLNLYLIHEQADRFPVHQDAHHILALHTFGVKRWLFWPPSIEWPMSRYKWKKEHVPSIAPLTIEVQGGDVLYLPTGWRHRTENVTAATVHLSLGLRPLRWVEVLEKAVFTAAARHAILRAYAPFAVTEEGISYELEYGDDARELLKMIAETIEESTRSALEDLVLPRDGESYPSTLEVKL